MWAGMLGHLKAEEFQVKKNNRCIRFVYSYTHGHSYHIKWNYLQHWWVRQWDCLWGSEPRQEYRAKGLNTMHLTTLSNKASIQTYLSRRTCWLLRRTACGNLWTVVWMYQEWAKQQPSFSEKVSFETSWNANFNLSAQCLYTYICWSNRRLIRRLLRRTACWNLCSKTYQRMSKTTTKLLKKVSVEMPIPINASTYLRLLADS